MKLKKTLFTHSSRYYVEHHLIACIHIIHSVTVLSFRPGRYISLVIYVSPSHISLVINVSGTHVTCAEMCSPTHTSLAVFVFRPRAYIATDVFVGEHISRGTQITLTPVFGDIYLALLAESNLLKSHRE